MRYVVKFPVVLLQVLYFDLSVSWLPLPKSVLALLFGVVENGNELGVNGDIFFNEVIVNSSSFARFVSEASKGGRTEYSSFFRKQLKKKARKKLEWEAILTGDCCVEFVDRSRY
jgi:hypothetical protein